MSIRRERDGTNEMAVPADRVVLPERRPRRRNDLLFPLDRRVSPETVGWPGSRTPR